MPELMTTAEVAAYLRLKQRKVYELVRNREIPCARVTGKLLFPRRMVDLWIEQNVDFAGSRPADAPLVFAGSHDRVAGSRSSPPEAPKDWRVSPSAKRCWPAST